MPFSIIFQLYRGGQFYWYEETRVPGENHLKQLENMYMMTNDTNRKRNLSRFISIYMTTYLLRINNIEKQTIQKQGLMNVEFPCLILIIISPPFWGGGWIYHFLPVFLSLTKVCAHNFYI